MCTAENLDACITSTNENSTFEFQSKPCHVGSLYKGINFVYFSSIADIKEVVLVSRGYLLRRNNLI